MGPIRRAAFIYHFDDVQGPVRRVWSGIDTVYITADFLNDPTGFMDDRLTEDVDDEPDAGG